jgi:phosphomannomutase
MPHYASTLRDSIVREVQLGLDETERSDIPLPLAGLRIVLNSGHGSGGFFYHVLHDLGADLSQSQHLNQPDATFPSGIPNPESDRMVKETTQLCEEIDADIGIMLDTDADRCGFIVPTASSTFPFSTHQYQPLNRNRLIALLGRIFSERSPGCAIVTDSVTSEGLAKFLSNLGVKHVRYLKGYANVIEKAMELSQSGQANAEVAIETSGHCAMKENGYLDDGTYTAVKVIACLAQVAARDRCNRNNIDRSRNHEKSSDGSSSNPPSNLLDLISALEELEEVRELRLSVTDGSLATTESIFQELCHQVDNACHNGKNGWELDVDNLEGIRVRTPGSHGGFFMIRKSLHDPLLSLQVEGRNKEEVRAQVIQPTLKLLSSSRMCIAELLDVSVLQNY